MTNIAHGLLYLWRVFVERFGEERSAQALSSRPQAYAKIGKTHGLCEDSAFMAPMSGFGVVVVRRRRRRRRRRKREGGGEREEGDSSNGRTSRKHRGREVAAPPLRLRVFRV